MNISQKIDFRLPEGQLLKLLGFAHEMLSMIESDMGNISPEEQRAAKELRHIINKMVNIHKEQTNGRSNNNGPVAG
jgi:hypothetical protein